MLPWQPAIVYCVMFDAMLLSDLANKFSLSLSLGKGEEYEYEHEHTTSYSTLIKTVRLSCTVSSFSELFVKSRQF